ncbi:M28 family metallopeptidase [Liberiplasma polymorphum]|uniref:M28 family metallopeptidase n=1 Tax=Liberiplasma polymorphum TaxID=3374570 RepID=UPI0037768774
MKKNDEIRTLRKKVFALTKEMINKFGPRLAGTQSSIACSEKIYEEMALFANHVEKQPFKVHKGAFLGWIRWLVVAYLIGIALLWLDYPMFVYLLSGISLLLLIFQFILYFPIFDWFYLRKPAQNIIGTITPTKEIKQTVIISGHHDSARIFNFFIHQPKLYNLRVTGSILFILLMFVFSLFIDLVPEASFLILLMKITLSVGILLIVQMWFFASSKGTPGAGDNLMASNIAVVLGEHFSQNPLTHTEIKMISFDAEEEGLRGAHAYAKKYKDSFSKHPTFMLNADCLYDEKELFFLTTDINGSVALNKELALELQKIAKSIDIKTKVKPIAFLTGGTDAAELAKKGVIATTLIGMSWTNQSRSNVYHTPLDTPDAVTKRVIESTINIFKTYIETLDKK